MVNKKTGFSPKKIAVIGAGPVGCIVGAFLAKGGYEVTLCDVIPELVDPAATDGITIEGAEQLHQKVAHTCYSVDELPQYDPDVIFITVKATALPLIVSSIEEFYKEGTYIISWQNGIDTELEVSKILGDKPVMRGVVNWGCGLKAPCHVNMAFHHPPHYLQEMAAESANAAVAVARALTESGLPTEHTEKIVPMVWQKSVLNACMNPVCALTGLTMAQATKDPIIFGLVDALMKECIKVARANEIFFGWEYYPKAVNYMKTAGNHKPSMLMDIENKRQTEIDYMNGKFIEYGIRAGVETPCNSTIQSLVKGLESTLRDVKK
jgi:2-dehydropantoate 2-reductase